MIETGGRKLDSFQYYFVTKRAAIGQGFGLILSTCAPRQIHPPHVHTNPGLMLTLAGDYIEETRLGTVRQTPLIVRYRPSWESHSHRVGPAGALGLHVEFDHGWLAKYELEEKELGAYRFTSDVGTRTAMLKLLLLGFGKGTDLTEEASDMAIELIEALTEPKPQRGPGAAKWLFNATDVIRQRFRERLSLSEVAYEVGISPMHLARTFRCCVGQTVTEYIRDHRLVEATRLILSEGAAIGEAAISAGFYDHAHFSRCFSVRFGQAPVSVKQMRSLLGS